MFYLKIKHLVKPFITNSVCNLVTVYNLQNLCIEIKKLILKTFSYLKFKGNALFVI